MLQPNEAYIVECNRLLKGRMITTEDTTVHIPKKLYAYYTHGGSKQRRGVIRQFRTRDIVVVPDGAKLKVRQRGVRVDYGEIIRINSLG